MVDFLWFFGIHGSNVLKNVIDGLFLSGVSENVAAVEMGRIPTEILTRPFWDFFVLIGGCGATISLMVAILLFGKRKSTRKLSKIALIPMLFNINELMTFGLPIIYNPSMLIPFILVPIVLFAISYVAMATGFVPVTMHNVNWTTPVIISGYLATGSIRGSILQVVNIAVGALIYRPFVIRYEKRQAENAIRLYGELVAKLKTSEEAVSPVVLTELSGKLGRLARDIAAELEMALENDGITMYYQPQYDDKKQYIGAEALMRWNHPVYGMVYPPLAIKLATECGFLCKLEEWVFDRAVKDGKTILEQTGVRKKISINASATTVRSAEFFEIAKKLADEHSLQKGDVCFEITEQTALLSSKGTSVFDKLSDVKALGYSLAIDDFSMGHTSIKYLQDNQFDIVKLDGVLIKNIQSNKRDYEIVKSIVSMSDSLGFEVIAEFVETEAQMQILAEIGCKRYQGYLFSPAVPCEKLVEILNS
jgi:EAL domain-containing protein (putative c-di-GMP-specific phosphodiesterase class I)